MNYKCVIRCVATGTRSRGSPVEPAASRLTPCPRPQQPAAHLDTVALAATDPDREQPWAELGSEGRRVRPDPRDPRPPADQLRAGDVLGDVERALLLQVQQGAPQQFSEIPPGDAGRQDARRHRRERRRHRHRPGLRRHLQGREPQPPVVRRALPGCGHRRRRHRPRHPRHGRPPGRGDGPAALRPARRPGHPSGAARDRRRRRRLRQLPRPAQHRRRGGLRRDLPRQPARQRALRRRAAARGPPPRQGERRRQPGDPVRRQDRRRRHRRRPRARVSETFDVRRARRSGRASRSATRSWRSC